MKPIKLFKLLNDIDEKYIDEASVDAVPEKSYKKSSFMRQKVSYIAACVALIVVIIVAANIIYLSVTPQSTPNNTLDPHSTVPGTQAKTPPVTSLPKITIDMDNFFALGGWESYHAYDVSELVNSNPWSDDLNIKALPVINNRVKYYTSGLASNSDPLAMVERLRETAGLIGLDLKDEDIKYIYEPDEMDMKIEVVQRVYAETDRAKIEISADLQASIWLNPPVEIEKYDYSSYEDTYKAAEYLSQEFKNILQMKNFVINVHDGSYNYYGDRDYDISFFEDSGSIIDQIINYNFNYITFYLNADKNVHLIRINRPDLSEVIGDYPITTPGQAEKLLTENKYLTTGFEPFPGAEYIRKVELVYRNGIEQTFIPFYRFYVELPDLKAENGLNTYGTYYVPAIEERFIENIPTYDEYI